MVRAIQAKHVMVVADSCYSGTLVRAAQAGLNTTEQRNAWLTRMNEKRSRTALVSGGLEPVIDAGGGGHSVFAKAFLNQLRDNPDVLDGQTLFTAVGRPVALESDQTPQYSDIRRSGHEGGDFLFVRLAGLSPTAAAPKADQPTRGVTILNKTPAPAAAPAANPAVELAFWNSIKDGKDAGDFEAYLSEFPTGTFVVLAQRRIKKLKNTQVAAAPKATAPVVRPPSVADANGTWKGFLEVSICEGFSGSPMVAVVKDGLLKGKTDNGVQLEGKMVSPTKTKGKAWHRLGFGTFESEYKDGKLFVEWEVHNSDAECSDEFEMVCE